MPHPRTPLRVDAEVAGNQDRLSSMGDGALVAACSEWAQRLDPAAVVARRRKAEGQRHVGLRPAPDQMTWLSALLPVKDGVASYARLQAAAERARLAGDERTRGQVMADTLVEAITDKADAARAEAYHAATTWEPTSPDTPDTPETTETAGATGSTGASRADGGHRPAAKSDTIADTRPRPEPAADTAETTAADTTADARREPEARPGAAEATDEPDTTEPEREDDAEPMEGTVPTVVRLAGELTDSEPDAAGQADRARSDVCLNLIMTDRTLFGTSDDPAWVESYGPVDADLAPRTRQERPGLAPKTLRRPRHGSVGRDGRQDQTLPQRVKDTHPATRPHLPHPLVRRARPSHRPHHPRPRRRQHVLPERPRTLRGLQPSQRDHRLDRTTTPRA